MPQQETFDFGMTEEEPGDWVPTHFWLTFEDDVRFETSDFFQIRRIVDAMWDGLVPAEKPMESAVADYLRDHQGPPQKRLKRLIVEMADGFQVEVDGYSGRVRLGDVVVSFRETGDNWSKDVVWFRRVRSEVRTFQAGGPVGPPIPSHLHAYGFGYAHGQFGRRVFLLRADHTVEWEQ